MTHSRGPTGQVTALVFVGILLLSIPAALAPTLANKAPNQEVSDAGSNVTTSMVNGTDIGTSTSPTPVPASAVATAKEEPPDSQLNTDRRELFHNRSTEALAQIAAKSNLTRELAVADETLASYQAGITEGQVGQNVAATRAINHQIAMHRTVIRRTDGLVHLAERDIQNDRLTRAVKLTRLGLKLQVRQVSARSNAFNPANEPLPSTQLRGYPSPSSAAFALVDRHNVTLTAEQVDDIRALDEVSEPTRSELTDVLAAYLAYENATDRAYGTTKLSKWKALIRSEKPALNSSYTKMAQESRPYVSIGSTGSLWNVRVNIGRIRGAQVRLMEETVDLQKALATDNDPGIARPASHAPLDGVQVEPVISINLSNHSNKYTKNYAFQIDRGGDDYYSNNAGGVGPNTHPIQAAALIDLAGEDRYSGKNGGANMQGSAFLLDSGTGDDIYEGGSNGVNGGGRSGIGFLADTGGANQYVAGGLGTNGGGFGGGFGFLMSAGNGNDQYDAEGTGTNGGAKGFGLGSLIDTGGDDIYTAGSHGTNGGAQSLEFDKTIFSGGYLIDANGNDSYTAGSHGTNGGGENGKGFLFDKNGTDFYKAGSEGVNGGAPCSKNGFRMIQCGEFGLGILLDGGGQDTYNANNDDFLVNKKGAIGIQVDLPVHSLIPNPPKPSAETPSPHLTPTSTPSPIQRVLHAEGTCDRYDDDGNGGHLEDKDGDGVFGHIQAAIKASTPGFTIVVHPCTYNESITVEKDDLLITGVGKPKINGRGKNNPGIAIRSSNVSVRGFEIRDFARRGAKAVDGSQVTIKNNIFTKTDGLYVQNSSSTLILNNTMRKGAYSNNGPHGSSGDSIRVSQSSDTVIGSNILKNPGCCYSGGRQINVDVIGIYVDSTTNATIWDNTVTISTIGHEGEAGILTQNTTQTSILANNIHMGHRSSDRYGILVYGLEHGILRSNLVKSGSQAITVSGTTCSGPSAIAQCPQGTGQPSRNIIVRSNTVITSSIGFTITNTRNPLIINNTFTRNSAGWKTFGIQLHGRDGRVINATIIRNRVATTTTGVRVTGAVNTEIISNNLTSNDKGIWIGFRHEVIPYLRDFRRGRMDIDQQQPTTGTTIRNNSIKRNLYGTFIDAGSSPYVVSNRFIENKRAIFLEEAGNPTGVDIKHNYFRRNVRYSIYNGNENEILNATKNEWAGGLPASPQNNSEDNPIEDPISGVLANGSGGPVSEGALNGVSNVHFCAESRQHCLDPPAITNLSAKEVETGNTDAEFDASWQVTDPGDNLESVNLTLMDEAAGETEETVAIHVSGGNASGTTRLVAQGDDESGHNYSLEITVTDNYGSTASDTISLTETEPQTPTATPMPSPTPVLTANGTGGTSGTGPSGSGAGGSGDSGEKSTSGGSNNSISQKSTPSDEEQTVTSTVPPTPTETPTETPLLTPTPEVIPGFGIAVWTVALAMLVILFVRRGK